MTYPCSSRTLVPLFRGGGPKAKATTDSDVGSGSSSPMPAMSDELQQLQAA